MSFHFHDESRRFPLRLLFPRPKWHDKRKVSFLTVTEGPEEEEDQGEFIYKMRSKLADHFGVYGRRPDTEKKSHPVLPIIQSSQAFLYQKHGVDF